MKKQLIASMAISVLLTGCMSQLERHQAHIAEQKEAKAEYLEEQLDQAPDWYLTPPKDDDGYYGVGSATGSNMELTRMQSKLIAEFDVVKKLNAVISGQERSYLEASNNGDASTNTSQVVDKFVSEQDVSNVNVVESKAVVIDGALTVYSLVHLSMNDIKKMTKNSLAEDAYQRLEKRVKANKVAAK